MHHRPMKTSPLITLAGVSLALLLTGCSTAAPSAEGPALPSAPTATESAHASPTTAAPDGFAVTSPDFTDGGDLADWATGNAFGGQCTGDNENPALEWQQVPEGTVALAITMLDASAGNYVHWVHTDIPADISGVQRGGSSDLAGVPGRDQATGNRAYFGPCPPTSSHRYVFTVWALDAPTELEPGFSYYDWLTASKDHVLGKAEITGMRGPAN